MMKKILITTIFSLGLLLNGCGSDESSEKKPTDKNTTQETNTTVQENNSSSVVDYTLPLKYNYNSDKSAIQELLPLHVNRYEDVQKSLDAIVDDKEKFENHYEWYVGDLISTQRAIDKHPSYAPRGEDKSLIVTVTNGQIDYSSYRLKGDINENGEVDFDDEKLLKEALLGNDNKYDINDDGVVDIKDTIDLLARLGTEITTFDFYSVSGQKLDIASRNFDESRSFAYGGTEQKVMVVAKDINGVSGFTSGLSDMDTLWYVGLSTQKQQKIMQKEEGLEATNPDRIKFVKEAIAYIEQTPEPYLLGWKISVKFSTTDSTYLQLDSHGLEDMDSSYFAMLEAKINPHFAKTKMKKPTKRYLTKNIYLYHIGAGRYSKDAQVDGKYEFDLVMNSFETHVKAFRKTLKHSTTINGKTVVTTNIAHASSVVFTSKSDKTLSGFIKEDGELIKDSGKIKAQRIGPDPKKEEYEGGLEHAEYKLKNIPFGAYKLEYERACGCVELIDSEFIFTKNRAYVDKDFNIDKKEVKVKLTVRDRDKNLLKGENVKIESAECLEEKKIFLDVSDNAGKVSFDDVPVGRYKVYVDDVESGTIDFCKEFDGEALGEQLWDIDLKYEAKRNSDASYSTFSAFKEWHWKKVKIAGIDETLKTYAEVDNLFNQKEFYYPFSEYSTIYLSHTNLYDKQEIGFNTNVKGETGIGLVYYESGGYLQRNNFYCIEGIAELIADYTTAQMKETSQLTGENYIMVRNSMRQTYSSFGCNLDFYTINTDLTNNQSNALVEHKAFTVKRTGDWGNLEGKSTVTVTFTPSR
jgi:hypothetical protein